MDQDHENDKKVLNFRSPSEVNRHKLTQLKGIPMRMTKNIPYLQSITKTPIDRVPQGNFRNPKMNMKPGKHKPGQKKPKKGQNKMSNNNNKRKKFKTTKSGRRLDHQHVKRGSGGRHKPHRGNKRLFKKAVVESFYTETVNFEYSTIIDLHSMSNVTLSSEEPKKAIKRQASDVDEDNFQSLQSGGFRAHMFHERIINKATTPEEKRDTSGKQTPDKQEKETSSIIRKRKDVNDKFMEERHTENEKRRIFKKIYRRSLSTRKCFNY
ncbi:hypothetical protein CEXT_593471 [Caerostris extrusa]|uniref:Uncharacterized protein n=1 Tax=Caerostris extrusa TaxID=172846 RepID=A0AAV4NVK5_CAEEX|nr:hypothetical protein CEXT_593471 [Caerostris extrusa]